MEVGEEYEGFVVDGAGGDGHAPNQETFRIEPTTG